MKIDDIDRTDPSWDGLWTLFAGYFHQDYDLEYEDWQSAVRDYRSGTTSSKITRTIEQLETLLDNLKEEGELKRAIEEFGLGYYPDIGGLTYRDWLIEIASMLREK